MVKNKLLLIQSFRSFVGRIAELFCIFFFFLWFREVLRLQVKLSKRALDLHVGWKNASKEKNLEKHLEISCIFLQPVLCISCLYRSSLGLGQLMWVNHWLCLCRVDTHYETQMWRVNFLSHMRSTACRRRSGAVRCLFLDEVFSGIEEGIPKTPKWKMAANKSENPLQFVWIKDKKTLDRSVVIPPSMNGQRS